MSRPFRAIVFDFDGVILESVAVKGRAFRRLFPDHPEHADRLEQYHRENGGLSRHAKIEWYYRELLGTTASRGQIDRDADRFGALIADEMGCCPFVGGAREFLEAQRGVVPMFVASGTPEPELRAIVERRGLGGLFDGVYGAPTTKDTILERIRASLGAEPREILFVGDGRQDAEAAQAVGVAFVGRVSPAEPDLLGDVPVMRVRDLDELASRLQTLAGSR